MIPKIPAQNSDAPCGDDAAAGARRNKIIGECAGHIHVAMHTYAAQHDMKYVECLQALLVVTQNLASLMRELTDATT